MSPEAHWADAAVEDLARVSHALSPALRRRVDAALGRIARMNGAASLREALTRPASTPFVALIDAAAQDLGLAGDPRVALLGRATVLEYAYVRLQDDLVDEPELVDRASVYAAEALLAEHLRLFAAAAPVPAAFAWRGDIMRRFADVAATEVDDRGAELSDEDLSWMGEKFLAMAVPLAAMAVIAGREARAQVMVDLVRETGCALQLVNDAYNVAEDALAGRSTPLLRWLRAEGVDARSPTIRARLFETRSLARALCEARRAVDRATTRATAAELPQLAAVIARVRSMVDLAPDRLCRLMLGVSV